VFSVELRTRPSALGYQGSLTIAGYFDLDVRLFDPAREMLVHFVTDEPAKIPAVRAMLEPQYLVVCQLLENGATQINPGSVLMIDADLRQMTRVEQIKIVLRQDLRGIPERLFVVKNNVHCMIAQAFALGATSVVSAPKEIIFKLAQIEAKVTKSGVVNATCGIANSAAALASMFSAVRRGQSINLLDAEYATSQVINSIEKNGLSSWLDDVRRYHEGTFQHCLLVTGVAVAFALEIGFTSPDVKRLGMAATLHDIGKARIPLAILDKPARLDPGEEEIMRSHPVIGYELLKGLPGITPEILDGVRHHHEYLDGSGYPDGLKAAQISDLVRLLTISDIFAALIESRPYRPQMSREDAYKILCGMDGKLERALVKAFWNVAFVA
jgi:putative nucleotidyltransferase with HDIG domain